MPKKPGRAGLDPNYLMLDLKVEDNVGWVRNNSKETGVYWKLPQQSYLLRVYQSAISLNALTPFSNNSSLNT